MVRVVEAAVFNDDDEYVSPSPDTLRELLDCLDGRTWDQLAITVEEDGAEPVIGLEHGADDLVTMVIPIRPEQRYYYLVDSEQPDDRETEVSSGGQPVMRARNQLVPKLLAWAALAEYLEGGGIANRFQWEAGPGFVPEPNGG